MTVTQRDDFDVLCDGVRRLCGLDLSQYKRAQMERRVRTYVERRGGGSDLVPFVATLKREPAELDAFLDRVTINVSELWRHPDQWVVLSEHVLPGLAAGGRLRAWSAGCSYGAEAYTLAAVCRDVIPQATVRITGTDIDRRMVERAREGVFSVADARGVPHNALRRHFTALPDGRLQADDALRRTVRFETGDLLRVRPPAGSFDLVLCRNTVIYFTEDVRDALHARLVDALRPGGVLVVGATERVTDPRGLGLTAIHPFTYRKS